jgi:hypothetical protein
LDVAKKSLTLLSSENLFDSIDTRISGKNCAIIAPVGLKASLESICRKMEIYPSFIYFSNEDLASDFPAIYRTIKERLTSSSFALFLSLNAHLFKEQEELISLLAKAFGKERLVFAGLRNPQDLFDISDHLTFLTYSSSKASIQALLSAMEHHEKPTGVIPVSNPSSKP